MAKFRMNVKKTGKVGVTPQAVQSEQKPEQVEEKSSIRFEVGKKEEDDKRKNYQQTAAANDTGIIQKVDKIIEQALAKEATDVHFEPSLDEVIVRIRVNGYLEEIEKFPLALQQKIANRIKVLSAMDITKNRIPQTGFFKVVTEETQTEILSCTFPTLNGEKSMLKIQYKRGITHSLEDLGMEPEVLRSYKDCFKKANGLIIVAGPPGNGKSTTLYATLNELNSPEKSVATFENVVKYEIPGVIQSKPDKKSDFFFEDGVQGIINIEPDVLLVGELQSPVVAKNIINAAFARRIVLGRMAADTTANALQNLVDMGIQPFLVSSAINGVLAQRLARKLCSGCKEEYAPPAQLLTELGIEAGTNFYRGKGCEQCQDTGYQGYIAIFEFMAMREELSELIVAREAPRRVMETAINLGMRTMKQDGIEKAKKGLTTIEEVFNAI